jgi:hypothetical protein
MEYRLKLLICDAKPVGYTLALRVIFTPYELLGRFEYEYALERLVENVDFNTIVGGISGISEARRLNRVRQRHDIVAHEIGKESQPGRIHQVLIETGVEILPRSLNHVGSARPLRFVEDVEIDSLYERDFIDRFAIARNGPQIAKVVGKCDGWTHNFGEVTTRESIILVRLEQPPPDTSQGFGNEQIGLSIRERSGVYKLLSLAPDARP